MVELPEDEEKARKAGHMLGEWIRNLDGFFGAFGEGLHQGMGVEEAEARPTENARRGWLFYLALLLSNLVLIGIGFLAGYLAGIGKL